jgi:transaldolase
MSDSILTLVKLGQSIWYDNIERGLLQDGTLARMIERGEIRGVTSNPSIFHQAITGSDRYDADLERLAAAGLSSLEIYENLAIADIQQAADEFRPLYDRTEGEDGYVSLEVNPHLATETEKTVEEARRLWETVDRPNLMVKIPATREGLPAIQESVRAGLNINITLIFSLQRYAEVMEAYLEGLEARLADDLPVGHIASVASFFVSRVDSNVDRRLEAVIKAEGPEAQRALRLLGRLAVANAKLAYARFKDVFQGPRFERLAASGARLQRPLWASTSTKNPKYSDVKYVEELIGPNTVNTVPQNTLEAFKDHGEARLTLEEDLELAEQALRELETVGLSMDEVTQELEEEGVEAFARSFDRLIEAIEERRH